jgi:hypothetical protein
MHSVGKRNLVFMMMEVDIVVEAFDEILEGGSHLFLSTSSFPLFTFYPLFLHGQILLNSWSIGMP